MGNDAPAGRPGFRPVHPGRIVKRNIDALSMTIEAFADHIDKSRQTVHAIIAGRSAVTADMAARLARAFRTTPQFWLNMQANHDVWAPERAPDIARIRPLSWRAGNVGGTMSGAGAANTMRIKRPSDRPASGSRSKGKRRVQDLLHR